MPIAVQELVRQRDEARGRKDFSTADALREQLRALGYVVEDEAGGTVLRKCEPEPEPGPGPGPGSGPERPNAKRAAFLTQPLPLGTGRAKRQKRNIRKRAKRHRATEFTAWLVQRFGADTLRGGAGVLDVAGGKGKVSYDLAMRRGIPCTVVDPRAVQLSAHTSRLVLAQAANSNSESDCGRGHSSGGRRRGDEGDTSGEDSSGGGGGGEGGCGAGRSTGWFHPSVAKDANVSASLLAAASRLLWRRGLRQRRMLFGADFCNGPQQDGGGTPGEAAAKTAMTMTAAAAAAAAAATPALWRAASVVIGMHPDEATEPIVDEALAAGKPFAVVPCCVFPTLFPNRRVPDTAGGGTVPVRTHEQFVRYLCAKHAGIRTALIEGLPGRNVVVYWQGSAGRG